MSLTIRAKIRRLILNMWCLGFGRRSQSCHRRGRVISRKNYRFFRTCTARGTPAQKRPFNSIMFTAHEFIWHTFVKNDMEEQYRYSARRSSTRTGRIQTRRRRQENRGERKPRKYATEHVQKRIHWHFMPGRYRRCESLLSCLSSDSQNKVRRDECS